MPPRWGKNRKPPPGFEVVEPVLETLENELRDKVKETNDGKRKVEALWPVHQINWQKTRYIYDMYYTFERITKPVFDYCVNQKLVDSALMAKWKKPGYERLCSTYVINSTNYKFGTTSLCRVPWKDRSEDQKQAQDPTTGCRGCASGKGAGPRNIFGNKYGQHLAAVQVAREKRMVEVAASAAVAVQPDDGDEETDDDTDDDFGPTPAAGVWAGSQKLEHEAEAIDTGNDEGEGPVPKKQRID
jgi:bud site selection protein 31